MLIDTHCHLDDERFCDDLEETLARSKDEGVGSWIIPGADPKHLPRALKLSEEHEGIYFAVGVHPYHASEYDEQLLLKYASHPKCVAVGECGLDYYRLPHDEEAKTAEKRLQAAVFESQIELAKKVKKPLIVHIRDASHDSKEMLLKHTAKEVGGVLHCFNADEQLLSLAKENFYFGIGGVLTFSNARKLVEILPKIPLEKLLFETDAPYLAPMPYRGQRNEPFMMTKVAAKASGLLGVDEERLCEISTQNAQRLFSI